MAANFAAPLAAIPSRSANCAAVRGTRVSAAVLRCRTPSRWPMAPASTIGMRRRMEKGTKVDSTRRAPPASTEAKPDPASPVARGPRRHRAGGQAQGRHDDELGQDQRRQRLDQAAAPVRHRRPDQRGQGQRQKEHGHVDRGGPHQQLEPQHEGGRGHQESHQQEHEGGHGRIAHGDDQTLWSSRPAVPSRPSPSRRPLRCTGVGGRKAEDHDLNGHHTRAARASGSCTKKARINWPALCR
jgi:hypothetical protein